MSSLGDRLKEKLSEREKENALRKLVLPDPNLIDFYSNDYLGFAGEKPAPIDSGAHWGSTGSRLLGGNSEIHENFENFLAGYHHSDAALLFNSGYAANTGLFSCLLSKGDTYLFDELCHASIRDGIRLNHATAWSFAHNDLSDLEKKIKVAKGRVVVVVESVYSMDGHFAPLKDLVNLSTQYGFSLVVDEAHAVGVFGKNGTGKVVEDGLEATVFARIITFGKALGAHGAAILGSKELRNYLINFSRPFIYTTALPPVAIEHLQGQYAALKNADVLRVKLNNLITFYRNELNDFPELKRHSSLNSHSAIQSIIIPGNDQVKAASAKLKEKGLDVRPILYPTVAEGSERLRICLHVYNKEEEIKALFSALS